MNDYDLPVDTDALLRQFDELQDELVVLEKRQAELHTHKVQVMRVLDAVIPGWWTSRKAVG